jgi:hypothetical protein
MEGVGLKNERRVRPRLSVSLPLEYRSRCDSSLEAGLLINLSDTGLLFYCRGDMNVGTTLTMTVIFPDGFKLTSFEVCAKIIWKDLHAERDWSEYKYGAEFTHISQPDREKLNRLLSTHSLEDALRSESISSMKHHNQAICDQATLEQKILILVK